MKSPLLSIIRVLIALLLPVPIFITIFFGDYFIKSLQGFDHELQAFTHPNKEQQEIIQSHLKTDLLLMLVMGYYYMAIHSLVYAVSLEWLRSSKHFTPPRFLTLASILGLACGLYFLYFYALKPGHTEKIFLALIASALAGFLPAYLLLKIKPKPKQEGLTQSQALP